jgi:hypothetical protein
VIARLFLRSLRDTLISQLANRFLAATQVGADRRRWGLILIGGIAWAVLGAAAHPFTPSLDWLRASVEYPFRALFAADVFTHILIGAFAFWLAYRQAAKYLQDIFELKDARVAERFIRQAAFASRYDVIEIKDGDVAEKDRQSPVALIGGPGLVRIYLENAALFEKVDGRARMIGPTTPRSGSEATQSDSTLASGRRRLWRRLIAFFTENNPDQDAEDVEQLEIFERLRRVVDLRDQVETTKVQGRTRDGIPVLAENLRFIFSVRRDDQSASLKTPYPFNKDAVKRMIYTLPHQAVIPSLATMIRRELSAFILRHPLGEFLAAIGWPEVLKQGEAAPPDPNTGQAAPAAGSSSGAPPPFKPRPDISDLFYDYNDFIARARERGVDLRWIGIGTWVLPDGIIPERHVQAWRITQDNQVRGSRAAINTLIKESQQRSLQAVLRQTPLQAARQLDLDNESARWQNMVSLVHSYRAAVRAAMDIYSNNNQSDSPEARNLDLVYKHLSHLVARFVADI